MTSRFVLGAVLGFVGIVAVLDCPGGERIGDSPQPQPKAKLSWDSPKLSHIEQLWRKKELPPDTDNKCVMAVRILQLADILKKELSGNELAEVAASCSTMLPREEDMSEFAATLLSAIVIACVQSGDRESLVTVLATRYPPQLSVNRDTEDYVVGNGGVDGVLMHVEAEFGKPTGPHFRRDLERAIAHGFQRNKVVGKEDTDLLEAHREMVQRPQGEISARGKFTDPVLIFTDACFKSKDKANRHAIAVAIRHAFTGLGVVGNDDAEFVENAVTWYEKNKDRLELNFDYCHNAIALGFFDYETNPIFLLKPSVKEIPALTASLKDNDRKVRSYGAQSLGKIGPEAATAVPALTGLIQDKTGGVSSVAAEALGNIGPVAKAAVPALMALLKDNDRDVWRSAAEALRKIRPEAKIAVPALTELLKDEDELVRSIAAWALWSIGGPETKKAIPALTDLLKDRDFEVRYAAVSALGRIGPDARIAVPALTELLKDGSPAMRAAATEALEKIMK